MKIYIYFHFKHYNHVLFTLVCFPCQLSGREATRLVHIQVISVFYIHIYVFFNKKDKIKTSIRVNVECAGLLSLKFWAWFIAPTMWKYYV